MSPSPKRAFATLLLGFLYLFTQGSNLFPKFTQVLRSWFSQKVFWSQNGRGLAHAAGRKTAGGAPHLGVGALHGRARRAAPGALLGAAGAAAEEPLAGAASGNWYWTESVHKLFINSGAPPLFINWVFCVRGQHYFETRVPLDGRGAPRNETMVQTIRFAAVYLRWGIPSFPRFFGAKWILSVGQKL